MYIPKQLNMSSETLEREDEKLNSTETSLDANKVTCKKVIVLFTLFNW